MDRICQIEGCESLIGPKGARGMCPFHYRRWNAAQPKPPRPRCTVEGCERPTCQRLVCAMHRNRMARTGSYELRPRATALCSVEDCLKPTDSRQLCKKHRARVDRHGSVDIVLSGPDAKGDRSISWIGDAATYRTVHNRLQKIRGKASVHLCVDCAAPAAQWSYNHGDPRERISETGLPYTPNLDAYSPRCLECHRQFDDPRSDSCPSGHPYMGENLIRKRDGSRACRTCKRAHARSAYHRRRSA